MERGWSLKGDYLNSSLLYYDNIIIIKLNIIDTIIDSVELIWIIINNCLINWILFTNLIIIIKQ